MSQETLPVIKKKVFIVITHFRQKNHKSWQTVEEVEVTNNLKDKHISGASVIIDVMNQKFVKNRFDELTKDEDKKMAYLAKYISNYKQQVIHILTKTS